MSSAARARLVRTALLAACCAAAGCNAIFGLDPPRLAPGDAAAQQDVAAAADRGGQEKVDAATDVPAPPPPDTRADASDAAPSDGAMDAGDGPPATCKGTAGPDPINIDGKFCIDSSDVTNSQYADFLAHASPSTITQPARCAWNMTFVPDSWAGATGQEDLPVVAADFCDAWSYCNWAGKRLCGRVGHGAGTLTDVLDGEFYYACHGGALHQYAYSYGDTYDATFCDTAGFHIDRVKSNTNCVSNVYPGLYDLNGNLEHWLDMCEISQPDGSLDACALSSPLNDDFSCGVYTNENLRKGQSGMTTIRCCSDPQ